MIKNKTKKSKINFFILILSYFNELKIFFSVIKILKPGNIVKNENYTLDVNKSFWL